MVEKFKNECPESVSYETMLELFDQFYRSYDLRMALAGDKQD